VTQCYGCQELSHVISNCPHCAEGTSASGATLIDNRLSVVLQRTDTSAQDMARTMEVNRRLEGAYATEKQVDSSTNNLLLLCDGADLVFTAPGAAAAGSSAGAVDTLSLPHVSPGEHKMLGWQQDGLVEQCVPQCTQPSTKRSWKRGRWARDTHRRRAMMTQQRWCASWMRLADVK